VTRRKRSAKKMESGRRKPQTRFTRRRKRRSGRGRSSEADIAEKAQAELRPARSSASSMPSAPRWTRAPRQVEPPPRNPDIFTYTYTIWKTS